MVVGAKAMIMKTKIGLSKQHWICVVAFSVLIVASSVSFVESAQIHIRGGVVLVDGRVAAPVETEGNLETTGAVLKTDPDLEALLEKANRHAEEGNYRVATRLWQAVLERSGDSLSSDDQTIYFSMSDRVERKLAQLPPDALAIYRVTADASAKELMKQADDPNDLTTLMQVAGNYFASSLGDDAAYRLGCLYLDRYDFSGARRMFEKVVRLHPDPSIPMDEIYARIAICEAFMGQQEMALESLESGKAFDSDSSAIGAVARSMEQLKMEDRKQLAMREWNMRLGGDARMGAMPELPESAFNVDQVARWQFYVSPKSDRFLTRGDTTGKVLVGDAAYGGRTATTRNDVEKRMIKNWAEQGLRPSGHLLFDEETIYFKAAADVVAFDREKVAASIAGKSADNEASPIDFANWRSLWRNVFEVDQATEMTNLIRQNWGGRRLGRRSGGSVSSARNKMTYFTKSHHFEDLIYQQMSIHDGVLYAIEGKSFDESSRHAKSKVTNAWNASIRRTRNNFLTAYEKDSGRMLWRLPRINKPESPSYDPALKKEAIAETQDQWLQTGGMMAAPVSFANILIVPVNQNGAIHLYGIDPANEGKTVWSAFLCDEPESGSVASSPVNLSIDGSDLFASCGTGVLFVVDPTTGKIRFAKRYEREGTRDPTSRRYGYNAGITNFDGWSSDTVVPNGRELICFRSDVGEIEAVDRNDGSVIWKTGLSPYGAKVDYIIGAYDDLLYLGGKRTIIALDLKGQGRVAWGGEPMFDGEASTGRGMVTPQGVFMPVGKAIWRFGLRAKNGRADVLNQVEAFLGTEAPVGNLFSDGERIWVHGGPRLYALSPKPD
jgi:outer membrane protein assembly factor BamB